MGHANLPNPEYPCVEVTHPTYIRRLAGIESLSPGVMERNERNQHQEAESEDKEVCKHPAPFPVSTEYAQLDSCEVG